MMRRKLKSLIIGLIPTLALLGAFVTNVCAQENNLNVYLFYSKTCSHCSEEKAFLEKLTQKYGGLSIKALEITTSRENLALFVEVGRVLNADVSGIPFLLIGDEPIVGYQSDETTGMYIESKVLQAFENPPEDLVQQILNPEPIEPEPPILPPDPGPEPIEPPIPAEPPEPKPPTGENIIEVPIFGLVDTTKLSLPVLTFVIALLDGFNPCAMWVLFFLIGLLLGMKDRKRMWILGSVFIAASGFVYFLFLAAWLNFFLLLGYSTVIRLIIGFVAVGTGVYYLSDYIKNKDAVCKITENKKRQRVFERLRSVAQKESLILAIIGMVLLAFAVNVVELLCSAGLPAVYTKALTMSDLPKVQYYLYLIFYIVVFMLDDMIVFAIAMTTLKALGVDSKYARYSHLVGGVLIFAIGILMLFKPEFLMFG